VWFIIWSGYGLLVPVICFASWFLVPKGVDEITGDPRYWQTHLWPRILAFVLPGAICGALGWFLNREERIHTFYFIPMEYWGMFIAALGVILPLIL
jgi:hypothetical protein